METTAEQGRQRNFELIAEACHEANRAYCKSIGDDSQPTWNDAPKWQRESALNGVMFHYHNPNADASASHESWYKEKEANGWSYGPVKDPINRRHPCFVPYKELPVEQQIKDHIFRSICHGLFTMFNVR